MSMGVRYRFLMFQQHICQQLDIFQFSSILAHTSFFKGHVCGKFSLWCNNHVVFFEVLPSALGGFVCFTCSFVCLGSFYFLFLI